MKGSYTLTLNAAEWDEVADALRQRYEMDGGYRAIRIMSRMHKTRPRTKAKRLASSALGVSAIYGAVMLPWDRPGEYERRQRSHPVRRIDS